MGLCRWGRASAVLRALGTLPPVAVPPLCGRQLLEGAPSVRFPVRVIKATPCPLARTGSS